MKRILGIAAGLLIVASTLTAVTPKPAFTLPTCLQDQYGNQYDDLVVDSTHNIVTGAVTGNQEYCSGSGIWTMVGSWSVNYVGQTILEISVANDESNIHCAPIYKLKGPYPNANWFYDFGYKTNQEFKYSACSTPVAPREEGNLPGRGMLRAVEK